VVHVRIATEDAHGLADESVSTIFEAEPMSSDRLKAELGAYRQLASGSSVESLDVIDDLENIKRIWRRSSSGLAMIFSSTSCDLRLPTRVHLHGIGEPLDDLQGLFVYACERFLIRRA
jgi:hypothetical protein